AHRAGAAAAGRALAAALAGVPGAAGLSSRAPNASRPEDPRAQAAKDCSRVDAMTDRPAFTLGVEEEFQIIDPETRQLKSHVQQILEEGKLVLKERVKPEMHQSVVELGTGICRDVSELRRDVVEMRREIIRLAAHTGMRVAAAGTHPFSDWADQQIFPDPRYDSVVEEMQVLARANLIFGLHVHVGIEDRRTAFQI